MGKKILTLGQPELLEERIAPLSLTTPIQAGPIEGSGLVPVPLGAAVPIIWFYYPLSGTTFIYIPATGKGMTILGGPPG